MWLDSSGHFYCLEVISFRKSGLKENFEFKISKLKRNQKIIMKKPALNGPAPSRVAMYFVYVIFVHIHDV